MLFVSLLQSAGIISSDGLFERSMLSNVGRSGRSRGMAQSLLFCSFRTRSESREMMEEGNSSREFSDRVQI